MSGKSLSLINGPNLNLLGTREPEVYGSQTLDEIVQQVVARAKKSGYTVEAFQSNQEGELVTEIQRVATNCSGIIINPAGYTHTSVAIRDALSATNIPIIEVHLSNIYQREPFRQHSYVSGVATGVISGLGSFGYLAACDALIECIKKV